MLPGKIHIATNCEAIEPSCQRYFHVLAIDSSVAPPLSLDINYVEDITHVQQSTHEVPKSASQTVFSKVLLTLHATHRTPDGASRLLDAMFAWSVKTRRAPSRIRRDASVYSHMTTGMHDNEYPPPKWRQLHLDGIKSKTWCSRPRPCTSGLTSSRAPTETYRLGRWKLTRWTNTRGRR